MNRTIAIAAGVLMTACVTVQTKPMTDDVAQKLKGKSTSWVVHKKPDFGAMTPGKAAFGLIGAALMISAGNEIVEKNKIDDPAVQMTSDLVEAIRAKYGVSVAAASTAPAESDEIEDLAKQYPKEDLLLNVQTVNWSFAYFPTNWSKFRVIYSVKASLIDLKTKQVLAEGMAKRVPDETPESPTYDELVASDAARLKAELRKLSAECYQELLREVFKL